MKTSKAKITEENRELSVAVSVRDFLLSAMFRSEVTYITKGTTKLGICGETAANGGVVVETCRDNSSQWYVVGVYYWETWYQKVRNNPFRSDDKEGQDLRTCAEAVARHVSEKQGAFYAKATQQAVCA